MDGAALPQGDEKQGAILLICPVVFFALFTFCFGGNALGWLTGGFDRFWFTIVLFQYFAIYLAFSLFAKWARKGWLMDAGMVAASCVSLLAFIIAPGKSTLWMVLCMENFCKYLQFYTLGILCRKYMGVFASVCSKDWFRTGSILGFIVLLLLYFHDDFKASGGVLYQAVHDIFVRYAGVFVVVAYFYAKKDFFDQKNRFNSLLGLIGRRTLDIYMIHYFFLPDLSFMGDFLKCDSMILGQIFVGLLLSAMVIAVCLLLSSILRTSRFLSEWLFGVAPRSGQGKAA